MAVLNSWQKVDRVLPGRPYGDGLSGSATISSDPNTRTTITGTATQSTGTAGATTMSNGDLVMLIQSQGTGVGQYEFNWVLSGGGTTSLTFQQPLQYTYGTGAQIIKVPRYITATVSAHSVTAWNGTTGGVEVILAQSGITVTGALNGVAGFRGGASVGPGDIHGKQGESYTDNPQSQSTSANENAGGGGQNFTGGSGSGGGAGGAGHAASGSTGHIGNNGEAAGVGGGTSSDSADATNVQFGGAGGSGGTRNFGSGVSTVGGTGGGIVFLISDSITLSSTVSTTGQTPAQPSVAGQAGSGGGAGGFVVIVCRTASLGTNNATAAAGGAGSANGGDGTGGAGGVGRIAVHHSGTVTGTTSPTFNDTTDSSLVEKTGAFFAFL